MTDFFTAVDPARRAVIAALAVLPLVAAAPGKAPRWSATVKGTDIGATVIGNPAAKLRLTEYFSYTCGACGAFAANGMPLLRTGYIDTGKVAFEYRNLVRDPLDMTAALLAKLGGAAALPGHYQAIMLAQKSWLTRAIALGEAVQKSWYEGEMNDRVQKIARDVGLDTLMRARGATAAQIKAALTSEVAQAELTAMTNLASNADHVHATPSFLLDGKLLDKVHDWASLKTRLDRAVLGA